MLHSYIWTAYSTKRIGDCEPARTWWQRQERAAAADNRTSVTETKVNQKMSYGMLRRVVW
jgi:hypothetical protein